MSWSTKEVDMMLWQYAVGILDLVNQDLQTPGHEVDLTLINLLAQSRREHLHTHFNIKPSFGIEFSIENASVKLKKVAA